MKTRKALGASRNMLQHGVALLAATTCLAALAVTFTATAATCTWTGGGDGSTWNDTDNWENGVKPTSGQGDAVVLSGKVGGSEIQNDMGAISVAKITFTGENAVTFSSPSVVTLVGDSSRRVLQMDASGTVTVSAPLSLPTSGTNVVGIASGTKNLHLDGNISGIGAIWFSGNSSTANKVYVSGTNSYGGDTRFSYCTVYAQNVSAFGADGNRIHCSAGGGNLQLMAAGTYHYSYAPYTEAGTCLSLQYSGTAELTGGLELASDSKTYIVGMPNTVTKFTLSGPVSGSGKLRLSGSSSTGTTIVLSGDNSHGGTSYAYCTVEVRSLTALGAPGAPVAHEGGSGELKMLVAGTYSHNFRLWNTESHTWRFAATPSTSSCTVNGTVSCPTSGRNCRIQTSCPVYFSEGLALTNQNLQVVTTQKMYFEKPIVVQKIALGSIESGWSGECVLDATGNEWSELQLSFKSNFKCGNNYVLDPARPVLWMGPTTDSTGYLDLNGKDQAATALVSDPTGYDSYKTTGHLLKSSSPATLFLNGATSDATAYGAVNGAVSLVWNPGGAYTQTLLDRTHGTTGSITVSNGTFCVGGTSTMRNLSAVKVAGGATFDLSTSSASSLAGLVSLTVEDGGTLYIGDSAGNPFGEATASVELGETATLRIPSGVTCSFGTVYVWEGGVRKKLASGAIYPATAGGGSFIVSDGTPEIEEAVWDAGGGANDGISLAANWSDDKAHDLTSGWFLPTFASAGTSATIDSAVTFKGIAFDGAAAAFTLSGPGSLTLRDLGIADSSSRTNTIALPTTVSATGGVTDQPWNIGAGATLALRAPVSSSEAITLAKGGPGTLSIYEPNLFTGSFVATGGLVNVYAPSNAFGLAANSSSEVFVSELDADYEGFRLYNTAIAHPIRVWGNSDLFGAFLFAEGTNVLNGKITTAYTFRPRLNSGVVVICTGGAQFNDWVAPGVFGTGWGEWIFRGQPIVCRSAIEIGNHLTVTLEVAGNQIATASSMLYLTGTSVLNLCADNALNQSSLGVRFDANANGSRLKLNGHSQTIGSISDVAVGRCTVESMDAAVLSVNQDTAATLSNVEFTGGASLSKAGSATLTIDRSMSSTGTVAVTAGTLAFTSNGSWAAAASVSVSGSGRIELPGKAVFGRRCSLVLSGDGVVAADGAGVVQRFRTVVIDGVERVGTIGAIGSGADYETSHVAGTGLLQSQSGMMFIFR